MKLIGFNYKKISAEKLKELSGTLKFNTKIDISSIEPLKTDFLKTKEDLLKVDFAYTVSYEPDFAKLSIEGSIILAVEPKLYKEILKEWKEKKTSEEFRIFIFNVILRRSNIKTLQLEEELGLPSHIPLPSLSPNSKKESKNNN